MTGRGLALIEALSHRWGVDRGPGEGKTVWSELLPVDAGAGKISADEIDELLSEWDDEPESAAEHYTVVVDQRPTRAGIDPLHKLTDRISLDNVVSVRDTTRKSFFGRFARP